MKTGDKSREIAEKELYRSIMGVDSTKNETYVYNPKNDNRPKNKERCEVCGKHSVNFPVVITDKDQWCVCHADIASNGRYFNKPI